MTTPEKKIDLLFWTTLTAAVLLVVLFFGLRPKGMQFENPVSLIPGKGAIVFGKNGIAFADDVSTVRQSDPFGELTIEMAVLAANVHRRGFGSLLMMHDGSDSRQLIVGQWESSIIVMNGNDYDHTRRLPRLTVKDVFSTEKIKILTITASAKGTYFYIDGGLAGANKDWQLTVPDQGNQLRLILGNSVTGKGSWTGEIYGLAVYGTALPAETVNRHYERWGQGAAFTPDGKNDLRLLYTFNGQAGRLVPDKSEGNQPLQIPKRAIVLKKTFLSAPWHQFKFNRSFLVDTILNLIGFIPMGAVLYGWLRQTGLFTGRNSAWATLVICSIFSLCIEILQAWMPTRSSSLMDWSMNTLGAWLGIWLFARAMKAGWVKTTESTEKKPV